MSSSIITGLVFDLGPLYGAEDTYDNSVQLLTPGYIAAPSRPTENMLCVQPGSWSESPLGDGRVSCSFEMTGLSSIHAKEITKLSRILSVAEVDQHPRRFPRVIERSPVDGGVEAEKYARIFGGMVQKLDDRVVSMWGDRSIFYYRVTYIRSEMYEGAGYMAPVVKRCTSPHGQAIQIDGLPHEKIIMPSRLHRVSVKPEPTTAAGVTISPPSAFNKLWMGIMPNRSDGRQTATGGGSFTTNKFNSVIDIDEAVMEGPSVTPGTGDWFGKYPTANIGTAGDADWSGTYAFAMAYNASWTPWNNRMYTRLDTWNSDLKDYEDARFNLPGRYHVLMRYQFAIGGLPEQDMKALIAVEAHGSFHGSAWNFVESAGRKYLQYEDEALHWVDLGELSVGGPDYSYELAHHSTPNNYCIALQSALLGATEEQKGNLSTTGVRLLIDRFVLVPADNFLFANCPADETVVSSYARRMDILTDDQMNATAYVTKVITENPQEHFVKEGDEQAVVVAKVTELETNNWSMPQMPQYGHLVIVAEDNGVDDSGHNVTVEMYSTARSRGYFY